jgi:hypothetical protein
MDEPSFYAIIPATIRYDKSLPPNAKLLYGEITALCNKHGYCWAENGYFADLYDVENETISRWISKLKNQGYIKTELIYKEGTKEVQSRRIYLLTNESIPIDKKINTPRQKNQYPIDEKVKDNNTLNNTSNNLPSDDFAFPKRPFAELEVNHGIDSKLHAYLDAIAECFKLTRHNLADSRRWEKVCMKAIDSEMPVDRLTGTLKSELIRNANTPHFLSPENILKQAQITNISYGSKFVNEFTGRGLK